MTCPTCLDLLQQHLDGAIPAGVLHDHLDHCPHAQAARADIDRLLAGVSLLQPPPVPADLAERITADLLAAARRPQPIAVRPRRFSVVALAVAASLLLALGLRLGWPGAGRPTVTPPVAVHPPDPPLPPLRDTVSQGATAVAALTARTAAETVEGTTVLLPPLPAMPIDPLPMGPADVDPTLEPLQEVGEGLKAGLRPVTDSARRAVSRFFELPLGRSTPANKPG